MQRVVAEPETIRRFLREIKESPVGEVHVPVRIEHPSFPERYWESDFLVDTASTYCQVPADVLADLGIDADEIVRVWLADESSILSRAGYARFTVAGLVKRADVVVGPPDSKPLLGVLLLQAVGLLVDPLRERLLPRTALSPALD